MAALTRTIEELVEALGVPGGPLVLSPTARSATALRRAFDLRQQAAGSSVWTPAPVLAWAQWMNSLWGSLLLAGHDERTLLNAAQERALWRSVIADDPETNALTAVDALAGMAQTALHAAAAFRAETQIRPNNAATPDARAFARWMAEFAKRCERGGWIVAATVERELIPHVDAAHLGLPQAMELVAFAQILPAQQALLEALDAHGCTVDVGQLQRPQAPAEGIRAVAELPDEATETEAALLWLRDAMDRDPAGDFALLVPDPAAEWPRLEPALRAVLVPGSFHVGSDVGTVPWETDGGSTLTNAPMVAALLDLLAWLRDPLPVERVTGVLLSPFFAAGPLDERARFDVGILGKLLLLRPELDLRTVYRLSRTNPGFSDLASWLQALVEWGDKLATGTPRKSFAEWTELFRSAAQDAGWPERSANGQALTASERRLADAFDSVLDTVATLDFAGRSATLAEALDAVTRQAGVTAIPGPHSPRLHILTPNAADGMTFSAAVFLRSTNENLPLPTHSNPLLDWALQRGAGMPGTDPATDEQTTQRTITQVVDSTTNILFTSASEKEAAHTFPSRIPSLFDCTSLILNDLNDTHSSEVDNPLEVVADDAPLPPLPARLIQGGARVLQLQAACGFLAFAEMRLGGRDRPDHDAGFDPRESGSVLHRALEFFWREMQSQDALRNLSETGRENAIRRAVDSAISKNLSPRGPWDGAYLDLVKERMRTVLRRWLNFELDRAPFTVIGFEREEMLTIGPLELKVRLDRIDRTDDDGFVLVDYKTGAHANPAAWKTDRPDEPQLPLYSLIGEAHELRGLVFAKMRPGEEMQWSGYISDDGVLRGKGVKPVDFATETAAWRDVLEVLADDFTAGRSDVSPKSYATNCKRCSQRLLCRLDVEALMENAAGDGEDEAPHA